MLHAIDTLARIIGYGAIALGVLWIIKQIAKDRRAARADAIERERLGQLRERDPATYEREMWWRNNMERKRRGLPTDPEFEAEGRRMAVSAHDAGLL